MHKDEYFDVALEESKVLVNTIMENNLPYMQEQAAAKKQEQVNSKGYSIEILNASGINGLAASYETLLTEKGYTITHVGNYTLGSLTRSRIIVKEAGLGQDLLEWIGEASVEVGNLPNGVEIQILLGTMAGQ